MIDLRSDVVAPPTEEMWEAMRRAELGWAMVGEDPSVNELEALGAELLGKEAALFVPTCSAANLLALLTLARPGDQVVLESTMHLVWSEGMSLAFPAGLFPRLVNGARGALDPLAVEEAMTRPHHGHLARTALVCLENSHTNAGGAVISAETTASILAIAHRHGASVHLDGARLFNAAVALGVPARELAAPVDTVAISLNKSLCAPEGALLCGSRATIAAARINAKRIGLGSQHKAGIVAAAGLVGLRTMIDRLAEDNHRASALARHLTEIPGLLVDPARVETNIVVVELTAEQRAAEFVRLFGRLGVLALARSGRQVRFVTHRLIDDSDIEEVAVAAEAVGSQPVV